jgi:hypothetical protein
VKFGKEGIWKGSTQNMLPITPNDKNRRKSILSIEVLRRIGATVRAIKSRLASKQTAVSSGVNRDSATREDEGSQTSGSDSRKSVEEKP